MSGIRRGIGLLFQQGNSAVYKEGNSLGTDSAETCSAKVLIPGRQRKPDDCRTDTFVTTALCQ